MLADRPETLELMRRNMDVLAQDFREIGYEDAQFSFGDSTPGDASSEGFDPDSEAGKDADHGNRVTKEAPVETVSVPTDVIRLNDRLDIRM